jgi:myo-inositol-1(or 4)-monophosphatase
MATSRQLKAMMEAAEKGGRSLLRHFARVRDLKVIAKGPHDFVSVADHTAEKIVMQALKKAFPAYGFFMEEGGVKAGADNSTRWIIDPLDGTTNFLHGVPHWAVSIGLERDGKIVAGVVYDPCKKEMFTAEKGKGAFVNGKRLRISAVREFSTALVAVGGPRFNERDYTAFMNEFCAVNPFADIRRFGAASLDIAYVAAGRFESFWERQLNAWDVAAGSLLVTEAGGIVSDMAGGRDYVYGRSIIVGNPAIYPELLKKLKASGHKGLKKVKSAS